MAAMCFVIAHRMQEKLNASHMHGRSVKAAQQLCSKAKALPARFTIAIAVQPWRIC